MKNRIIALLVAGISAAGILAGCGSSTADSTVSSIVEKIPENDPYANGGSTNSTTASDSEDHSGQIRSPLTNEWIDASLENQRPIAVMYPTDEVAMPQYGYDNIDVFYEIMEEDRHSRQMAIMQDYSGLDKIGNIRSTRDYFVYAALEWDAILVHYGAPEVYCKDVLTRSDVDNINGVGGDMGSDYGAFYRDNPNNIDSEHTAYTSSALLESAIEQAGFQTTHRDDYYVPDHYQFADDDSPNTLEGLDDSIAPGVTSCTELSLEEAFPTDTPVLTYNESDGKYYRSIYGEPQVDGETGTQLSFDNVIIQWTYYEVRDGKGYLTFKMHDLTHDGFYITKGKMIHITWQKEGDYEPTRYYYENGEEVTFNTGKTMVFVVQDDKAISVNGKTVNPADSY